jgi:tocopherol cyclase
VSFPSAYMWIQARDHDRSTGICLAGGTLVPGVQAYLVGYQGDPYPLPSSSSTSPEESPRRFVSFMPPSSTSLPSLSLGLISSIDWPSRCAEVDIKGWFTRIRITAHCEPDTFFNIAAPLNTGHAAEYTTQSFAAIVEVTVWERTWPLPWSAWRQVERNVFERGSLEFGGGFYKSHSD